MIFINADDIHVGWENKNQNEDGMLPGPGSRSQNWADKLGNNQNSDRRKGNNRTVEDILGQENKSQTEDGRFLVPDNKKLGARVLPPSRCIQGHPNEGL
jgi:hypothetical protein